MNRYILGAFVLGITGFIIAFGIHSVIQPDTSSTSAQLSTQQSSESIEEPNSDASEVSPTWIAPRMITVHPESVYERSIENNQPITQTSEEDSPTHNHFLLSNKLFYPFEMFTWGGGLILIVIILVIGRLTITIRHNIDSNELRGTDFIFDRKTVKKFFTALSIGLLLISVIGFIENAQKNYYSLDQEELESVIDADDFSSFVDFILQDSEGLPEPFNNSSALMRIIFYVVLFSVAVSFSVFVFGSTIKSLTSNYYELMGEEFKNDDEHRLERFYAISMGQTVKSFWLSFILISTGFMVIICAVGFAATAPEPKIGIAIIGGISGIFLEFIGGTALLLYSKNAQYFKHFFDSLIRRDEVKKAVTIHNDLASHLKDYPQTAKIIVTHLTSKNELNDDSNKNVKQANADKVN